MGIFSSDRRNPGITVFGEIRAVQRFSALPLSFNKKIIVPAVVHRYA